MDWSTGEVFVRDCPSYLPVVLLIEEALKAALATLDENIADVVRAVDWLLSHADAVRRLRVRANADNAADADRARRMRAEGNGAFARLETSTLLAGGPASGSSDAPVRPQPTPGDDDQGDPEQRDQRRER